MATQFGQMNLSRQSSGETPEPPSGPVYPPSLMPQPAQQPSYVIASTGQQLPAAGFSGSAPSISQQVLQAPPSPQGFVQQPPPAQMPIYYYPSGQYPTSTTQQYRPIASVQYSAQRGQQMPQTAQQAGTWNLSPVFSSNPVIFARKSRSCPLWMSIQAWQFKSAHFPYSRKIMEHLINSMRKGNRYKKVKPPSLQHHRHACETQSP